MKRFLLVPLVLSMVACTSVPVQRKFPEVPSELMTTCPDLKQTPPTEKLSEVLNVVVENYGQYHECRLKADTWVEWYKTQKQIFDSVK